MGICCCSSPECDTCVLSRCHESRGGRLCAAGCSSEGPLAVPPCFQMPSVLTCVFLFAWKDCLGLAQDTSPLQSKSTRFQYAPCFPKVLLLLCLQICFLIKTSLLSPFFRIYTGSDRHTDAACCSCYSSRDVQDFHDGRGMPFAVKSVLNGFSGNLSWGRETPDLIVELYWGIN